VEEEEISVSGQAYFLAMARLESAWVALSGTRIVGQNKAGIGWPVAQFMCDDEMPSFLHRPLRPN
jgi:hypothetical protein